MWNAAIRGMIFSVVMVSYCFAGSQPLPTPDFMLWGRYTVGQVKSSITEVGVFDYSFKNEWLENIDGGIRLTRQVSPRLLGRLNIGFTVNASTVRQTNFNSVEFTAKKFTAALLDATLQYTREKLFTESGLLQFEFGYFPFKYNPQSTNLGEYLFRSNCYPALIVSGFENSIDKPKLAGIHAGYTFELAGKIRQDLLLTSELDIFPLRDINLTYIATYAPHPVFTLGAGIECAHLIVLDSVKTTPGLDTLYRNTVDNWVGYVDPVTNDTTRYTFRGTKVMARATMDIKSLIEMATGKLPVFGKEDLKVYGEAAILGVKNYSGWYDTLNERIPFMAGVNWPTHQFLSYCLMPGLMAYGLGDGNKEMSVLGFSVNDKQRKAAQIGTTGMALGAGLWALEHFCKINTRLDLLSAEIEFFHSPYWNSQEFIWKSHSPVPYTGSAAGNGGYANWNDSLGKTDDDIKWSVYASKKIGSLLRISAQVASDHTPRNWYTPGPPSFVKYTDMVPRTKDWYYMMRMSFYF